MVCFYLTCMILYDKIWIVWYDIIWYVIVWCDTVCCDLIWHQLKKYSVHYSWVVWKECFFFTKEKVYKTMTILISVCVRNSVFIMKNWFAMIEIKCEKLWKRYNYVFWILLSGVFNRLVFDEFIAEYKHTCILVFLDHTSHSGDLCCGLASVVMRRSSSVVR